MVNVTSQRASRPAATLSRAHSPLTSVLQPLRPRARDTFAVCVDMTTAFNPIYPPLSKRLLTSDILGRKASWGNLSSESQPKTRVLCTRLFSFASWHALAFASPRLPRGFSRCITRCNTEVYQRCSGENSLPTRGIKGQDNRGRQPTVTLFSPRTRPSSFSIRKRHSNETRDSTAVPPLFSLLISWGNFSLFRRGGPLFTLFSMEEMLL